MADRGNAKVLEIFRSQTGQKVSTDVILAKCRLISFETELSQPVGCGRRWTAASLQRFSHPLCPGRSSPGLFLTNDTDLGPCAAATGAVLTHYVCPRR
jgi:hypothetical protein